MIKHDTRKGVDGGCFNFFYKSELDDLTCHQCP